jgi:hypothetical protein
MQKKVLNTNLYPQKKSPPFVHSLNRTYDSCCNIYNPITLMHVYWVAKKISKTEMRSKKEKFYLDEGKKWK